MGAACYNPAQVGICYGPSASALDNDYDARRLQASLPPALQDVIVESMHGLQESTCESNVDCMHGSHDSLAFRGPSMAGALGIKATERSLHTPVTLNIYDLGTSCPSRSVNKLLRPLGTGAFHCGVEVHGREWSYSNTDAGVGDGIFCCLPCCCMGYSYCESVLLGRTSASKEAVQNLILSMKSEWAVEDYGVLAHNCCHFCDSLSHRLGVVGVPAWVKNLAGAAESIVSVGDYCPLNCCGKSEPPKVNITRRAYSAL